MKNVKVSVKMVVCFSVMILLSMCICVVGILSANEINNSTTRLYDESLMAIEVISEIRENFQEQRVLAQELILVENDPVAVNRIISTITENKDEMSVYIDNFSELLEREIVEPGLEDVAATKQEMLISFTSLYYDYFIEELDEILRSVGNLKDYALDDFVTSKNVETMSELMNRTFEFYTQQADERVVEANYIFRESRNFLILVMAVTLVISALFLIYIPYTIARPLRHLVKVADAVAAGDMNMEVSIAGRRDEVGLLANAFARMKDEINKQISVVESLANADLTVEPRLRGENDTLGKALVKLTKNLDKIISEVSVASDNVARGAKQVATESQELAQGTTEQAASVEQLSSAFFEISLNTKENANSAGKAASVTDEVKRMAVEGEELMTHLREAVEEADMASRSIDKIIKVIEEISFQTNILALNAAVEAAHAGQNGSGFAVVAAEVRSLASKSAASSKETSELIANALEKVQLGSRIANQTSDSFKQIVSGIIESTRLISDIAKSSEEQAIAIEQINTGIGQVAQVIHINSGAAEKCASEAEKMSGQSKKLEDTVSQFKMKNDNRPARIELDDTDEKDGEAPKITIDLSPDIPSDGFGKY